MRDAIEEMFQAIEQDLIQIGDAIMNDELAKAVVPYGNAMLRMGELNILHRFDRLDHDARSDFATLHDRIRNITLVFERVAAKSC